MLDTSKTVESKTLTLRKPTAEDGSDIWELVRRCKPLDENSMYCNLVQCDHFRDTCVVAEHSDHGVIGWISGHQVPNEEGAVFVWQVAVAPEARGMGLGGKMLSHLVGRPELGGVSKMQTTITADNEASWALFRRFAQKAGGELSHDPHFTRADHFDGRHATEHMVTITLDPAQVDAAPRAKAA